MVKKKTLKEKSLINKKVKYTLFFGFYLVFFVTLYIMFKPNDVLKEDKNINIYDIISSIKDNYSNKYSLNIKINDEEIEEDNKYSYYYDIYNLNKLIKNSKLISSNSNIYNFELTNNSLNEIFNTNMDNGINTITLYLNKDNLLEKTIYDLSNYYKEKVIIEINYEEDRNE